MMNFRLLFITASIVLTAFLVHLQGSSQRVKIITAEAEFIVTVEVARTTEEKRIGLMGRENLLNQTGMLFVYGENSYPAMWMKGMLIPLDILFIGSDLQINHIEEKVPPCRTEKEENCPIYQSSYTSAMVLELPSGYAAIHDIEAGDYLELLSGIEIF